MFKLVLLLLLTRNWVDSNELAGDLGRPCTRSALYAGVNAVAEASLRLIRLNRIASKRCPMRLCTLEAISEEIVRKVEVKMGQVRK